MMSVMTILTHSSTFTSFPSLSNEQF